MKIYFSLFLFLYFAFICAGKQRKAPGDLRVPLSKLGLGRLRCEHNTHLNLDVNKVNVHIYDFKNNVVKKISMRNAAQTILLMKVNQQNLIKKIFGKSNKLYLYVGGSRSCVNDSSSDLVRTAFAKSPNSNLIIIDYSTYNNDKKSMKESYDLTVKYAYNIGKQLGQMLADLYKGGVSIKNIHCIGYEIGAHIVAYTGEHFFRTTGQKISKITGLDPAGPCFSDGFVKNQIRSGVAQYVEVYHCNAGGYGTSSMLADTDYFMENRLPLAFEPAVSAERNHKMCLPMWMASVVDKTLYKACKDKSVLGGKCPENLKATAGFWNPGNKKGIYYLSTEG